MNGNGNDFLEGNGILIILFFFLAFSGGFGAFGGNNASALENQNVINKLDTMATGLGNATWRINDAVAGSEASLQKCCCETNRNIDSLRYDTNRNVDALRYDNERTGSMVVNAIHSDGEATRKVINDAITQNLRDQLEQARGVISNTTQSRYILESLGRYVTNPPCYPQCNCGGPCGNLY